MAEWKGFERLAAQIYRELAPEAKVTANDKIVGRSGFERQIDVSVRAALAGHEILIVIDTKDYAVPADVGAVDEFAGKVAESKLIRAFLSVALVSQVVRRPGRVRLALNSAIFTMLKVASGNWT